MAKFVEKDNAEKRDVFIQRKNRRLIIVQALRELIRRDDEPGKMKVDLDAAELEKTNRAAHRGRKLQPKRRGRASFYKVTSAGASDEINNRIGSMGDS